MGLRILLIGTRAAPAEYWAISSKLVNTKRGKATRAVPPDLASQVIVAIPVLILYEISIYVSKMVIKRQEKNA